MAEYRPSLTPEGREGLKAEIFLYDTLPGGAGFSGQLVDQGLALFERALKLMQTCPENCDASCYRCLRSFKNKFEHGLLDRHVGAELLEYLLTGQLPDFDSRRLRNSTDLLHSDLQRQGDANIRYELNSRLPNGKQSAIQVPILATRSDGKRFALALSAPLTIDHPADPSVLDLANPPHSLELIVVNELLVRGNLPAATQEIRQRLART